MAHVLIAEDDPRLAEIYRKWLETVGHTVRHASSGLEGLRAAVLEGVPDLLVTDLMMPEGDGDDLLAACASMAPDLPVLVVTGCEDARRLGVAREQPNVRRLLKKPITHEDLLDAVHAALG